MKQPEPQTQAQANEQTAIRVSWQTIIGNIILTAIKLAAGILSNSGAMLSDAIHSLSDVLSTGIVILGVKLAYKASDKNHQYGHERLESVAAILLAVILAITGGGIGYAGIQKILASSHEALAIPGLFALIAAVLSIVVKEGMYWYTIHAAKRINSVALRASAWHHRSDALSSVGSFAGILGARMGLPVLDPIASVIICLLILKAAYDIFMDAIRKMTDEACDDETVAQIRALILKQTGVLGIDKLKTRIFGDKIYVDVDISADGASTLQEAHTVAEHVHRAIENTIANVKHCMVHVNPSHAEPLQK